MYLISVLLTLILPQKMVFMENNSCSEGAFEKIAIVARQQPEADSKSVRSPLIIAKRSHLLLAHCLDTFRKWPLYSVFHKRKPLFIWHIDLTLSESGLFALYYKEEAIIHLAHCLGTFRKWPLCPVLQRRSHFSFGPLT